MELKINYRALDKVKSKYEIEMGKVEKLLYDKINFDFSLVDMPGDG